jgi:DNA-directed RNA polymerase subunit M/transcription elongation factor TFIIS
MRVLNIDDLADDAYEMHRSACDMGEKCPSCYHWATSVIPITVTMDMQGTVLFRCEQCGHEWPDPYAEAPHVQA